MPSLTVEHATQALSLLPVRCAAKFIRRPASRAQLPVGTRRAFGIEFGIYEPSNHKALLSDRCARALRIEDHDLTSLHSLDIITWI